MSTATMSGILIMNPEEFNRLQADAGLKNPSPTNSDTSSGSGDNSSPELPSTTKAKGAWLKKQPTKLLLDRDDAKPMQDVWINRKLGTKRTARTTAARAAHGLYVGGIKRPVGAAVGLITATLAGVATVFSIFGCPSKTGRKVTKGLAKVTVESAKSAGKAIVGIGSTLLCGPVRHFQSSKAKKSVQQKDAARFMAAKERAEKAKRDALRESMHEQRASRASQRKVAPDTKGKRPSTSKERNAQDAAADRQLKTPLDRRILRAYNNSALGHLTKELSGEAAYATQMALASQAVFRESEAVKAQDRAKAERREAAGLANAPSVTVPQR